MLGAAVSGKIADLIGPRGAMWFLQIFFIIGWLSIIFAKVHFITWLHFFKLCDIPKSLPKGLGKDNNGSVDCITYQVHHNLTMSRREEPREVGPRPTRGDVGESSSSNPAEPVDEDTLLRDLIASRVVPTRRDNVEAPIEEGKSSVELALNRLLQRVLRATIATHPQPIPQPVPQPVVQVEETPAQKRLKIIKGFSQLL
ncbi:uncharacterized protein LOC132279611 [Cornus florida]|uniref:uncharacterized protein LOC132279611 n=1 Tax=Cornus florida TaxID=4283 RepID=UPI0028987ED2|nr:uncharacterized protein LOC132279611 [Cornus florida]XP_059637613.1 uncharacterized protein LOC132279611 [Cornus florida]